jgi:hypothetical protein
MQFVGEATIDDPVAQQRIFIYGHAVILIMAKYNNFFISTDTLNRFEINFSESK